MFLLREIWNFINTNLGYALISLASNIVIAAAVSIIVAWYFSKKAEKFSKDLNKKVEKLQMDLSGFIIQEITKNSNYVYPFIGKDGKLHKAVEVKIEESLKLGETIVIKKNNK